MTNLPELLEFGDSRLPEHTKDLPFEIRHISPATGFGVFSKVDITEGTSLFVEAPLVNFPLFTFPEPILKKSVCSFCRKYLKSLEHQINLFVGSEIKSLPNIDAQESYLSDLETCSNNCGELYCSQKCKERDWEFSHKLLCPKGCAEWDNFYAHSLQTGNSVNFVMAARLYAHILLSSHNSGELIKKSIETFLKYFYHKEWRETVLISASDAVETRLGETLDEEITTSFALLKKLFEYPKDGIYAPLFTMELYSKILGVFNLNNICVEIESPLSQYVLQIHNLPKKFKVKAVRALAPIVGEVAERKRVYELSTGVKKEDEEEEEYDDEQTIEWTYKDTPDSEFKKVTFSSKLFPDYEGSGLYPLVSKFNHNCAPNVSVEFADSSTAFAIASRDIRAGEEMTISYVDLRMDFEDRRKELNEYFFVCKCGVCELEQNQTE